MDRHGPRPCRPVTVEGRDYVEGHLEFAYAETVHAAQGRTVDHAVLLADDTIDARSYVGLTHRRATNDVLVATPPDQQPLQILENATN